MLLTRDNIKKFDDKTFSVNKNLVQPKALCEVKHANFELQIITDYDNSNPPNEIIKMSETGSNSNSTNQCETRSLHCLFCFQEVVSTSEENVGKNELSSIERSKLVKNFCEQLHLNSSEIPEECDKRVLPICEICEFDLSLMLEHEQTIRKLSLTISMMARRLESNVIRRVEIQRNNHGAGETVINLWDMIMDGYRKRQNGNVASPQIRVDPTIFQNSEQDQNGETTITTHNNEGESENVQMNPGTLSSLSVNQRREVFVSQEASVLDDEIQEVCPKKRRLFGQGIEYFHRYCEPGNQDNTYLQCSLCPHTVPNPKKLKLGQRRPRQKMIRHMKTVHKRECKKKAKNKTSRTTSAANEDRWVRAFVNSGPQQASTSRDPLNMSITEAANGDRDEEGDFTNFVWEPWPRKRSFNSVEIRKYISSQGSGEMLFQCGRCKKTFPVILRNENGEAEAYGKLKAHIQTTHRNRSKMRMSAAQRTQALALRLQSEQLRVKLESSKIGSAPPINLHVLNCGGERAASDDTSLIPTYPFTQSSPVDGDIDQMSDAALTHTDGEPVPNETMNTPTMMMRTPSPAPYSPFYRVVYPDSNNIGGV